MPRAPRPIKIRGPGGLKIKVVGYKTSGTYLFVEKGNEAYGFVEDKDIKRLKAWCDDALRAQTDEV